MKAQIASWIHQHARFDLILIPKISFVYPPVNHQPVQLYPYHVKKHFFDTLWIELETCLLWESNPWSETNENSINIRLFVSSLCYRDHTIGNDRIAISYEENFFNLLEFFKKKIPNTLNFFHPYIKIEPPPPTKNFWIRPWLCHPFRLFVSYSDPIKSFFTLSNQFKNALALFKKSHCPSYSPSPQEVSLMIEQIEWVKRKKKKKS